MNGPKHTKAHSFLEHGLFDGLRRFSDLENRIAALGDDKAKGGAFEVFAEAYLATQRKHDADKVWPLSAVPLDVLRRLGLSEQDYGVDGVFLTLLGYHNAYQVKFRSERNPLTWRELSTFMGLADSPHIRSRILITNCDELPGVLNERQGFFCIRGSDLDRLQPEDFRVMESWLAESAFEIPKKQPQEHQTEALAALVPALRIEDRVSAIMACGTGKTLVALWVAERLQGSPILVLLPSLALLRQTLHEWLRETNFPALTYLCVCSDPTVKEGIDELATQQSDLDFEVSTNPNNVRQFLDAPFAGTKVVFSTYQSASVVGQALKPGEMFDLGIFDEAHKTAGREGRNFGFALDDVNLPIRKRLFVTATPRHYNPHKRDREGEAQVVFSMDNPEVYGRQTFRLTFGEAARRNIICNYKVIISVITSEMVTNELLTRGEVMVNGDAIRARQVANQIALHGAIEKYGVSKIFTFHKTVKSAASFVADGSEGIRTHLTDFGSYHVNGGMPTARRERVMREFRGAARAVMSNARCLTESHVPSVDMVAFLSPRRSRVDIVQATGRAMRKAPNKIRGYVLVPLYVEQEAGESVQDAIERSDFGEVWDVLQSLQEQDEVLANIIRDMNEQRGQTKGFDDARFRELVEFMGETVPLEVLRRSITTICLDNVGSSWDEYFGKLRAYKELKGDCNVPVEWPEDRKLGTWASSQRQLRKENRLSIDRIKRLDQLGYRWTYDERWEDQFTAWLHRRNNPVRTDSSVDAKNNRKLDSWEDSQRDDRKSGDLSEERIQRLTLAGFDWGATQDEKWERRFSELVQYKAIHGNCDVKQQDKELGKLGQWIAQQREEYKSGKLRERESRIQKLNALGFPWELRKRGTWEEKYEEVKAFKREHGHCKVPKTGYPKLGAWINAQHIQNKKGVLSSERISLLDAIGFVWRVADEDPWDLRLAELKIFKNKHGHCNVATTNTENKKLGNWVSQQRQSRKKNLIKETRIRQLDELGFEWSLRKMP